MLTPPFTDIEVRVLGALAEKAVTTPDTYPLSLSALTAACNQTTNRDPVMRLDEENVAQATVSLRRRDLLRAIQPLGSRVTKYQHLLNETFDLDAREIAVLSVLMLRGEQTIGELHTRTARLAEFADVAAIEHTLDALIAREPEALAIRLPRRAGQKEVRYTHLLSGAPVFSDAPDSPAALDAPTRSITPTLDRIAELERAVEELRAEVQSLKAQFVEFRAEFQ